jgi:rhomboid protease GluP
MFQRKRTGSILCPSCGKLVGVADEQCWNCGRRNPGMWGLTGVLARLGRELPFENVVIGACVFLYLAMLAVDPQGITNQGLFSLLAPSGEAMLRFGASGALPLFGLGRWWSPLSAGWLHAGLLHIGFNLYWIRMLAPATSELYGPSRMVVIYTVSSAVGFLASSVAGLMHLGGLLTLGASAPIMGLLGAMVYYGRRTGSHTVGAQAWSYAIFMFVFGLLMRGVDNWAHFGGFAGGFLAGWLLDPARPERPGHTAAAVACLVLTALSIAASLLSPRGLGVL